MALTKTEQQTIENVIARLRCDPIKNWGGTGEDHPGESDEVRAALTDPRVKRYLDTWVTGALALLLPGERRDPELARRLSGR